MSNLIFEYESGDFIFQTAHNMGYDTSPDEEI